VVKIPVRARLFLEVMVNWNIGLIIAVMLGCLIFADEGDASVHAKVVF
jgi:hypothetical protein